MSSSIECQKKRTGSWENPTYCHKRKIQIDGQRPVSPIVNMSIILCIWYLSVRTTFCMIFTYCLVKELGVKFSRYPIFYGITVCYHVTFYFMWNNSYYYLLNISILFLEFVHCCVPYCEGGYRYLVLVHIQAHFCNFLFKLILLQ